MRLLGPVPTPGQTGWEGTGMGLIGAYARVTPLELDRALKDPEWAAQRIEDLEESTYPGQDSAGTDRYVVRHRQGLERDLVPAERRRRPRWTLVGGGTPLGDDDLGYGPAR